MRSQKDRIQAYIAREVNSILDSEDTIARVSGTVQPMTQTFASGRMAEGDLPNSFLRVTAGWRAIVALQAHSSYSGDRSHYLNLDIRYFYTDPFSDEGYVECEIQRGEQKRGIHLRDSTYHWEPAFERPYETVCKDSAVAPSERVALDWCLGLLAKHFKGLGFSSDLGIAEEST